MARTLPGRAERTRRLVTRPGGPASRATQHAAVAQSLCDRVPVTVGLTRAGPDVGSAGWTAPRHLRKESSTTYRVSLAASSLTRAGPRCRVRAAGCQPDSEGLG